MSLLSLANPGKLRSGHKDKEAAGTDVVVINKSKRSLFGPRGPVNAESPMAPYYSTRQYVKRYFLSNPGKDYLAGNREEHERLDNLISDPNSTSKEILTCRYILEYRLNKIDIAEQLLNIVGIPLPQEGGKNVYPRYFSTEMLERYIYRDRERIRKWESIFTIITGSKLFGLPLQEQGRVYDKPERYIAAAFFFIPGINLDVVRDMVAAMLSVAANENDPADVRVLRPEESCTAVKARSPSTRKSKGSLAHKSKRSSRSTRQKLEPRISQEGFELSDVDWPVLSKETASDKIDDRRKKIFRSATTEKKPPTALPKHIYRQGTGAELPRIPTSWFIKLDTSDTIFATKECF